MEQRHENWKHRVLRDAESYVIQEIKARHPEWVEADGNCPKCLAHFEMLGQETSSPVEQG